MSTLFLTVDHIHDDDREQSFPALFLRLSYPWRPRVASRDDRVFVVKVYYN